MKPELPPPISPRQMDILRAVTAMAWADGQLEPAEISLMLKEFAKLFAKSSDQIEALQSQLTDYLGQNVPLEEVVPHIPPADHQLVAQLAYQVINASRRHPDEPKINVEEAAAFQRLVRLLQLTDAQIEAVTMLAGDPSNDPHALAVTIHEILVKTNE
jgi:Lon protease-like protein